jgi:hypothetical protein
LSKAPGCYRITVVERRSERAGSDT